MYCRFCGKEVKEKSIVCSGCGRPVDEPGSLSATPVMGWSLGLLLALMFVSVFFPPIGLYLGIKGLFSEARARNSADLMWWSSTFGLAVDR